MEKVYYWKNTNIKCFEGEVWKDIVGFEGYYQVSTFGRLKSLRNNIILKKQYDEYIDGIKNESNFKKVVIN